jgi:hypothetical protein
MMKLSVQIRDPSDDTIMAYAISMRDSARRKTARGMVKEVLAEVLKR